MKSDILNRIKLRKNALHQPEVLDLVQKAEPSANMIVSRVMVLTIVFYLFLSLSFLLGIYKGYFFSSLICLGNVFLLFFSTLYCWIKAGNGAGIKYELLIVLWISIFAVNMITGYKLWILFGFPTLLTCRYYNEKFTFFSGVMSLILAVASAFTNAFAMNITGYMDLNTVYFDGEFQMTGTKFLYNDVLMSQPDPVLILKNTLRLSTLGNCVILVCITVTCIMVIRHGQKLLLEAKQEEAARMKAELELEKSKLKLLNTQLKPHFLFNTLSAIMAIDGNPEETVEAIGEFGKYLRENLGSISNSELIPFSEELQHTRRYLSLEQLRFENRLIVKTDIQVRNFLIPPLSIQILCENAVKHGITEKIAGGTIVISTSETETEYLAIVEDDGVGFDPSAEIDTEKHVGLYNLRSRLETVCGGKLEIISSFGMGTKAIVHIPKTGSKLEL